MRIFLLVFFSLLTIRSVAQLVLNGQVEGPDGQPVFAANVYLTSAIEKGVMTGFDGEFQLPYDGQPDTLIVSFIGMDSYVLPVLSTTSHEHLKIQLRRNTQLLQEFIVAGNDPITAKNAVVKMDRMDVYLNPVSQGDPLKAITSLPSSSTTDESANISLRGSVADRSRVVFNGVPIYRPVRNSQINGVGNFSIFNPEMMAHQYVYASNPPLTYGNSSAGLIEVQTRQGEVDEHWQVAAGLASLGGMLTKKTGGNSFLQVYSNRQFSGAFIGLNEGNLPRLNSFYTWDGGINFHSTLNEKWQFNSFHYAIDEGYKFLSELYTYEGDAHSDKQRYFTVNNLSRYGKTGILSFNSGYNRSSTQYTFGNIDSDVEVRQFYLGIDYKWLINEKITLQGGISDDFSYNQFDSKGPEFFYAVSPTSPAQHLISSNENHIWESFLVFNYDINDLWSSAMGIRKNIPLDGQETYLSYQGSIRRILASDHALLLSGGRYHSYTTPNFYGQEFQLLKAWQLALDYSIQKDNLTIQPAVFYKLEEGDRALEQFSLNEVQTWGAEFFLEHKVMNHWSYNFSYSYLDQKMMVAEQEYSGYNDFNYFIKAMVKFEHPEWITSALSFTARPGSVYTPITSGIYQEDLQVYAPQFSSSLNGMRYNNYQRLDWSCSRYFPLGNHSLVLYFSLNNILNRKNQAQDLYSQDYSNVYYDFFQQRSIYFGAVLKIGKDD